MFYVRLNDWAVSTAEVIKFRLSCYWVIMNNESEEVWLKMVVAYFKIVFCTHLWSLSKTTLTNLYVKVGIRT
jgi:hypothetical protein